MPDFYTLWTDTGLTQIGDAALAGPFNITTAVVGDGNGSDVIPNRGQTALANTVWSGPVTSKTRSKADPNTIVFEFAIPAGDGPFFIREVGLADADGNLCITGNWPVTEKPVAADGAVRDMVLRVPVHFENAEVVNLVVDANVAIATQAIVQGLITTAMDEYADVVQALIANAISNYAEVDAGGFQPGDELNLTYLPSDVEMLERRMLERDGSQLLVADYPDLYAKIGRQFTDPAIDAAYFCLMDDRGLFERIWDHGAGVDPAASSRLDRGDGIMGDHIGTLQMSQNLLHGHPWRTSNNSVAESGQTGGFVTDTDAQYTKSEFTGTPSGSAGEQIGGSGGTEARPRNRYKMGVIFY